MAQIDISDVAKDLLEKIAERNRRSQKGQVLYLLELEAEKLGIPVPSQSESELLQ